MEKKQFERRPCPVCGTKDATHLFQQRFESLSRARLLAGYDVVICKSCGAGFADGIPDQTVFDEYYRDLSKYEGPLSLSKVVPPVGQRFRDTAQQVAEFIPAKSSRVFELGSGFGALLKALKDLGYANVLASDPSPGCMRAAKEFYDVPGIVGTVFTVPTPEQPYDMLVLTGVMEHIRDLDPTISRFRDLVGKTGRVYLEVPDASRYDWRLDAPFQEFSLEHINFFSKTSLVNAMQQRGFKALAAGHTIRPQHEVTCPCTYGVFQFTGETYPLIQDTETESGLVSYIDGCRKEDARIRDQIEAETKKAGKMIVWGVGAHTLRLLANGGLKQQDVTLFVDSNAKLQNQKLCGVAVVSPDGIRGRTEPILISSRSVQKEIRDRVRELGFTNDLILLYP